jgi:23S rRNA (cytidine1920-2'-O)/16S rRNA (cytidine1409-2'-O)-methyltransferase
MARQKIRLDQLLFERGLCESRTRAAALVMEGRVLVAGKVVDKPGTRVADDAAIEIRKPLHPFVSRGGLKLENALGQFELDVGGQVALDAGSSTGGFSDCLLSRGVRRCYALDVNVVQLHERVRAHPNIVVLPPKNARHLEPEDLPERVDLVVADLSFISLRLVLPALVRVLHPGGQMVVLIKPQFEVGKGEVGKGGVVRDEGLRKKAVDGVIAAGVSLGLNHMGTIQAEPKGSDGNIEFFALFEKPENNGDRPPVN